MCVLSLKWTRLDRFKLRFTPFLCFVFAPTFVNTMSFTRLYEQHILKIEGSVLSSSGLWCLLGTRGDPLGLTLGVGLFGVSVD